MLAAALVACSGCVLFTQAAFAASGIVSTYSSGNIAVAINDNSTSTSTINIADPGRIMSVLRVGVRLNHTFDSDLRISLVSPDGTTVPLSINRGGDGDNYGTGSTDCGGALTQFDPSSENRLAVASAPFPGTYRPDRNFGSFFGDRNNGSWTLKIDDQAPADTGTLYCWTMKTSRDNANPVVNFSGPLAKTFWLSPHFTAKWGSTDTQSGPTGVYSGYYYGLKIDASADPGATSIASGATTSAAIAGKVGNTYCVGMTTWDRAGNSGGASKCVGIPLDDKNGSLAYTGTWAHKTGSAFYRGTYSQTTQHGASVSLPSATASQLGLVVTKCPTCGKVEVRFGATVVGTVNLHAATTKNRQVVSLPAFPIGTQAVTVEVVSASGKLVKIDGIGIKVT